MTTFEGIWVPMITPFADGQIDLEAAQRLAQHLQRGGVDGLVVSATTGEAATLSTSEQHRLLAAVLEAVGSNCPVVFGISGNNTAEVASSVKSLENYGIAGVLMSAPYYVRPSQDGIRHHFETVAAETPHPILIYNIPYRTGVNIELETVRALSSNRQFVAIKESGAGNLDQLTRLINDTPLKVLSGEDSLIFVTCCLGGHGAISAAAHIRPDLYGQMVQAIQAGDLARARQIDNGLRPLIRQLFSEPNPAPLKAALAIQGLIRDEVRLPMTKASTVCRDKLEMLLSEAMAL